MESFNGGSVSVFVQTATAPGNFQDAVNYVDSGNVDWVAICDVNGDGKNDLVIASKDLEIRLQDPTRPGTFLAPTILASP